MLNLIFNTRPCCDQFQNRVSADQCHTTVLQAQVYNSSRCNKVFHSFLLTSYGIHVITGSENFTSKRHLLQVLTWLLALNILVTRTADRLDSTMDQELWMGPGQHATVVASNFC